MNFYLAPVNFLLFLTLGFDCLAQVSAFNNFERDSFDVYLSVESPNDQVFTRRILTLNPVSEVEREFLSPKFSIIRESEDESGDLTGQAESWKPGSGIHLRPRPHDRLGPPKPSSNIGSQPQNLDCANLKNINQMWWVERGQKTQNYLQKRLSEDIRFFRVDLADPQTFDQLDSIDQESLNEFAGRRLARASEWYLVSLINDQAESASDLIPDWVRDTMDFSQVRMKLGFSRANTFERRIETPENNANSLEAREQSTEWKQILEEGPRAEASSSLFEKLIPGDFSVLGRIRNQRFGWGLDWKPAPENLPLKIRYENQLSWSGQEEVSRLNASLDLLGFQKGASCQLRKFELVLTARYDIEDDNLFVGINFSTLNN